MAKINDRYIQFYTPGSAAVKVEIQEEQSWAPLPEQKPAKKVALYVDPVAIIGFAVAICMLILMAVGVNQLNAARREVATLEHYVAQLTAENHTLEETYTAGYELSKVRRAALDLGMVPVEEIPQKTIFVTIPHQEIVQEQTWWTQLTTFFSGLFA